jgi:hypothetical protein
MDDEHAWLVALGDLVTVTVAHLQAQHAIGECPGVGVRISTSRGHRCGCLQRGILRRQRQTVALAHQMHRKKKQLTEDQPVRRNKN